MTKLNLNVAVGASGEKWFAADVVQGDAVVGLDGLDGLFQLKQSLEDKIIKTSYFNFNE